MTTFCRAYVCHNGTKIVITGEPVQTKIVMPDETTVLGEPQGNEEQACTAKEMGYASPDKMVMDHDPLHALLADWLGQPYSYSMMHAAGKLPPEQLALAELEEAAVMAVQRYMVAVGATLPMR